MTDLAVFYEHPRWFEPLFAALDRRGLDWRAIGIQDHAFDPAETRAPARVILNRLPMSSFTRQEAAADVRERIAEFGAAGVDLLLLQMSPQYEEMERFAAEVIAAR